MSGEFAAFGRRPGRRDARDQQFLVGGGVPSRLDADIKASGLAFSGDERIGLLTECERGEDYTVSEYRDALAGAVFSPRMRKVIHSQFNLIHASHERMRRLRNLLKA